MLISYNWLRRYLPLPESPETILPRLVQAGVEVGSVRQVGGDITGVVVAELLSVEKHPQADRLSLTQVTTGAETFRVVCGAKNIAPGQKVPLAKLGAVLPGDFKIKPAKIRGEESQGMLCSAKELGLAADAEGILILPADAPLGQDFTAYMGLPDTVFELEITPNRSDLLSHLGLARELGALLDRPVQLPEAAPKESAPPAASRVKVSIEAPDLCFLYSARLIEGVKVGPSPHWLSQALERVGQKSINNVVDVTNFVLMETGQPLHAFDLGTLSGGRVAARRAKAGEKIPLLDGTERELKDTMLVIADAEKPVALAGVMGGANSQVKEGTRAVLLEAALFLPGSVRKTARSLSISTDSSYRFERGVDPQGVARALDRAAALILETAGGTLATGVVQQAGSKLFAPAQVRFRPGRCRTLLGTDFNDEEQLGVLRRLGCAVSGQPGPEGYAVTIPGRRVDLEREIDLIEEVARVLGYDRIPLLLPRVPVLFKAPAEPIPFEEPLRSVFHQAGLNEAVNSSFLSRRFPDQLGLPPDDPRRKLQALANPLADDQDVLRSSLLPSLLLNAQANLARQRDAVALYEINKVFLASPQGVLEKRQAAALLAGETSAAAWSSPARQADFFDLKGLAEGLLRACRLAPPTWDYRGLTAPFHPAQGFRVLDGRGGVLLQGGALHPKALKAYDIHVPCFALELDLSTLAAAPLLPLDYEPLPKFPAAWRDIALVVPDGVTSGQVVEAIRSQGGAELREVLLFDLYRGPHVAPGHRSLAYRLLFQDPERTLTDEEVAGKVSKIVEALKTRYAIALR
ncbi:MAG TPA: phenylalanine--tRNA ligase subunit beta [bacterium]|nr:phenylalanine--tRNA ligase subunit beta [bacterium]